MVLILFRCRQPEIALMEFGNLWQGVVGLAAVINNVIGTGEALLARGLCGKNTFRLFDGKMVTLLSPR
jgi:hypothetical protein